MFFVDDVVEAIEATVIGREQVRVGDRFVVAQSSASGQYVRFYGSDEFVLACRFKRVGVRPGGCAPVVEVG
jgi:hypothetical protein